MNIPAARPWRWPHLATLVLLACGAARGGLHPAQAEDEAVGWYSPREEDFRPEYDRDRVNRRAQTWEQYWGWVGAFYRGNFLSVGWTKQAEESVAIVRSQATRQELIKSLNELGKQIAREWSKDNAVRKISTADLSRWGGAIRAARRSDDGSGRRLKATLRTIRAEVAKKLKR